MIFTKQFCISNEFEVMSSEGCQYIGEARKDRTKVNLLRDSSFTWWCFSWKWTEKGFFFAVRCFVAVPSSKTNRKSYRQNLFWIFNVLTFNPHQNSQYYQFDFLQRVISMPDMCLSWLNYLVKWKIHISTCLHFLSSWYHTHIFINKNKF